MMATTDFLAARPALATGAATLGALMPKCPLCFMAIISALGLELPRVTAWMTPLTIFFLSISLAMTAWLSRARRRWLPLALATVAAIIIIAGRVALRSDHVVRGGAVVLVGASIWAGRGRKICSSCNCTRQENRRE